MVKIGFIYFDNIHVIHHFVGVAVALSKEPNYKVDIITYQGRHHYLFSLLEKINGSKELVKQVPTYSYRKIIENLKKRKHPSSKYLYQKHKNMLLNYDVLVFTDISHEYLYQKKTKETPFFVLMMHGAGDGEYIIGKSYEYAISKFDLITLSGQKVKGFFKKMQNLTNTRLKVCGYQKFDVVAVENKDNLKLFKNDKPIVLYNPHFKENLSSWHQFGNQILAFFYNSNDYNLIFAPHINLFKSSKKHQLSIDNKYFKRENIHIDLGSYRSVNMSYTQIADIYLGDVSSQIYEFIIQPRPCIFINTHDVNWTNDPHYQNWKLGKVIPSPKHLDKILKTRESWHEDFIQKQQVAIATTFYKPKNQRVTQRIVDEIKELFKETKD